MIIEDESEFDTPNEVGRKASHLNIKIAEDENI